MLLGTETRSALARVTILFVILVVFALLLRAVFQVFGGVSDITSLGPRQASPTGTIEPSAPVVGLANSVGTPQPEVAIPEGATVQPNEYIFRTPSPLTPEAAAPATNTEAPVAAPNTVPGIASGAGLGSPAQQRPLVGPPIVNSGPSLGAAAPRATVVVPGPTALLPRPNAQLPSATATRPGPTARPSATNGSQPRVAGPQAPSDSNPVAVAPTATLRPGATQRPVATAVVQQPAAPTSGTFQGPPTSTQVPVAPTTARESVVEPTATRQELRPTAEVVPPTATRPVRPTAVVVPPTDTPTTEFVVTFPTAPLLELPTNTPVPVPPTNTPVPPTNTPVPVPPTNTPVPVPPTSTPVPPTPTAIPIPTATEALAAPLGGNCSGKQQIVSASESPGDDQNGNGRVCRHEIEMGNGGTKAKYSDDF